MLNHRRHLTLTTPLLACLAAATMPSAAVAASNAPSRSGSAVVHGAGEGRSAPLPVSAGGAELAIASGPATSGGADLALASGAATLARAERTTAAASSAAPPGVGKPDVTDALSIATASLESVASKAGETGRNVAMSLIGLALAIAAVVLAFRRDFKEAAAVLAVGLVCVLLASSAGVSLLQDTVKALVG
ncbi:MAG: hypothetical protein ACYCU0_13950 [Solirubrobacteraceae bacterium]